MKKLWWAGVVCGLLLAMAFVVSASPSDLSLVWWSVDGGGQTISQGGAYTLGGTVGQVDAGALAGGAYTLGGGFWRGGGLSLGSHKVYLPIVLRAYVRKGG